MIHITLPFVGYTSQNTIFNSGYYCDTYLLLLVSWKR